MRDIEALIERILRSDDVFRAAPSQDVIDLEKDPGALPLLEQRLRAGLKQPQALRALVAMAHCTRHSPVEDAFRLLDLLGETALDKRVAVRSRAVHLAIGILRTNRSRALRHGINVETALARVQAAAAAAAAQGLDSQTGSLVRTFQAGPWT